MVLGDSPEVLYPVGSRFRWWLRVSPGRDEHLTAGLDLASEQADPGLAAKESSPDVNQVDVLLHLLHFLQVQQILSDDVAPLICGRVSCLGSSSSACALDRTVDGDFTSTLRYESVELDAERRIFLDVIIFLCLLSRGFQIQLEVPSVTFAYSTIG